MPAKPFRIETRDFSRKQDAVTYFRSMLQRYRPSGKVSEEDARDLIALLKHHTEYNEKIGVGIDHFEVMWNQYGTHCFAVVRHDGTRDDFSYIHCITPKRD
ncbi:MAG TPA: DCL family protein [Stellaceae bacterium]